MASETAPRRSSASRASVGSTRDSGLGVIGCPTLVLVGDSDQLTPPELSAEITAGIPGHAWSWSLAPVTRPRWTNPSGHQGARGVATSLSTHM